MKPTIDQEKAINIRNANVLVSAAAGSGKTSVLVERIINRITDADTPVDIDRMLIMTFTNAAAAELRDRIREAIDKKIDEAKESDDNLEKQSILVHNAMITTIHGFCKSVISDHFEEVALDPNFRVADENECLLMRADAIDRCLEAAYEKKDPAFLDAVECFSAGKSDSKLADLVIDIYKFIMANPDPEGFIRQCCEGYTAGSLEEFAASAVVKQFEAQVVRLAERGQRVIEEALSIIDEYKELEPYRECITSYACLFESIIGLKPSDTIDSARELVRGFSAPAFGRVGTKGADDDLIAAKNAATACRDIAKSAVAELLGMLAYDLSECYSQVQAAAPNLTALCDLTLDFAKTYEEMKRAVNVIDFNDMEHLALKILSNPDIAAIYREHFDEIYVDEYQDSNMAQEVLVSLICKKDPGNVFCVGDIKQSIYRFRHARPDLFLGKYYTYSETGPNRRILLNDNFRSRREVVDSVNEVFSVIMRSELGGIEYDESAKLCYGASYYDKPADPGADYRTEIILGQKDELSSEELTANIMADKIASMIRSQFPVYDKETESLRPIRFSDITILVRSLKKYEKVIRDVFNGANIPLSVKGSEGYFGTVEIQTTLAFLQAVDNPFCDIPLTTLMRSPVLGFTDKELAVITEGAGKKLSMYDRVLLTAGDYTGDSAVTTVDTATDDVLKGKCRRLLDLLRRYKDMSCYTPVHYLISDFIDREYGDFVRVMSKGEQRMANLSMLLSKAEDFGKTSFKGLYQFNRYMDQIRKYAIDDGEASTVGENDDVVRLMTMHASKGLEYPVCFIAGIEKKRNTMDESGNVIWNIDHGFAIDFTDLKRRTVTPTLPKHVVRENNRRDSIAEEMRILYVAMTRAKEKLIMVGTGKEDEFEGAAKSPDMCSSYLDMLRTAYADKGFRHIDISCRSEKELVEARFDEELERESAADDLLAVFRSAPEPVEASSVPCLSHTCIPYKYPQSTEIKAKLSVSELKHRAIEEKLAEGELLTDAGEQLFSETEPDKYIPRFMRAKGESSTGGTFYGTAFHRIMELWEYEQHEQESTREENDNTSYITPDMIVEFADKMHKLHRIDQDMVDAIRPDDVAYFLNSPLGIRMGRAKASGKLFREQPFVIGMEESGETVLVQGIIDAYFTEEDGITIVDYKTDHVSDEKILINRYRAQLEYYGKALFQITGMPVKALTIYSTCLCSEIVIS